jgi:hypothetical protein
LRLAIPILVQLAKKNNTEAIGLLCDISNIYLYERAKSALTEGHSYLAIYMFAQLAEKYPDYLCKRAEFALKAGDLRLANPIFAQLAEKYPDYLCERAELALKAGDLRLAIPILAQLAEKKHTEAIGLLRSIPEADLYQAATSALGTGNLCLAISILTQFARKNPDDLYKRADSELRADHNFFRQFVFILELLVKQQYPKAICRLWSIPKESRSIPKMEIFELLTIAASQGDLNAQQNLKDATAKKSFGDWICRL